MSGSVPISNVSLMVTCPSLLLVESKYNKLSIPGSVTSIGLATDSAATSALAPG